MIETIENLAKQFYIRRKLRKKARIIIQSRARALALASLPFAIALAIATLKGSYLKPLYAHPLRSVMSGVAISSICLGVSMMRQM